MVDDRGANNTKLSSNHVRIQSSSQAIDHSMTTAVAIEEASSAERDVSFITNQTNLNLPEYKIMNPVVFCPKRNDVPLAIMIDLTCRLKACSAPL